MGEDRLIPPGTQVRLDSLVNDDDQPTPEFGVVVYCWLDDEIGMFDCYVAFFGAEFANGKPSEKPYVLRYAATSLTVLDDLDESSLAYLSAFLVRLEDARISYQLASVREGAVMVQIAVPGERWEIEFFSDRPIEVEIFRGGEPIAGSAAIENLFLIHGADAQVGTSAEPLKL